ARQLCAATPPAPTGFCAEQTFIPAVECAALMDIKAVATPGGLATWGAGDPCTWYTVICHEGHVTLVGITSDQVTTIPESIGNLSHLAGLVVVENQLTEVPDSLGDLTDLTVLILRDNQLPAVPDSIGNLTKLTELNLVGNRLR